MIQIEYRNGFAIEDKHGFSYYTMKKGVLTPGVSGTMARALMKYKAEIVALEAK